jgi:hypothetical protein
MTTIARRNNAPDDQLDRHRERSNRFIDTAAERGLGARQPYEVLATPDVAKKCSTSLEWSWNLPAPKPTKAKHHPTLPRDENGACDSKIGAAGRPADYTDDTGLTICSRRARCCAMKKFYTLEQIADCFVVSTRKAQIGDQRPGRIGALVSHQKLSALRCAR